MRTEIHSLNYSCIKGMGYYLPEKTLSNFDLEKMVNTSDEWIRQRTGIQLRHIAGDNELPSDMALKASTTALQQANMEATELDFILVATVFPDQLMPNVSCKLQHKLDAPQAAALDISAACSGFVYAFCIANQFIENGTYKNILVVGTEALHHITNYKDRNTCILFGDAAGAFILSQNNTPENGSVYHQELKAYGELGHLLHIPAPGAHKPPSDTIKKEDYFIHMDGQKVFKKAVHIMCAGYEKTLKATGFTSDQIDWVLAHQANERILKKFCEISGYPEKKVIFDIKETGNTSSASIPVSMCRAVEQGKIKKGQNILMITMGGGMTSGSVLLRY